MALLAGIAIRPRRLPSASGMPQRLAFRLGGILLLVLGAAWTAIALGHPLGMSGTRIVMTAAHALARSGGKRALATMCVGVGQGVSLALERV